MDNPNDHKIKRYLFLAVIIFFALFLAFSLAEFFTAFLAAVMFYVLSKPFVEWLIKRKRWKKTSAALLVIVITFFIILLPISLMGTMLFAKLEQLITHMQTI